MGACKNLPGENEDTAKSHTSGFSSMYFFISALHFSSSMTITSTPRLRRRSSSPLKFAFSPMTTRGILYSRIAPVHILHGLHARSPAQPSAPTGNEYHHSPQGRVLPDDANAILNSMPNRHVHQQLTIVHLRYTSAASLPASSKAAVSPWRIAEPRCTRALWPWPRTTGTPPSAVRTSAAPMGTPPSL